VPRRVKPLNAKQLEKWRPDPARTLELPDGAVPGLWVRLTPKGEMSWSLNVRVQGVRKRIAVGRGVKLAEARRKAEETRLAISRGEDPTEASRGIDRRRKAAAMGVGTLGTVIAAYFETGPGTALRSGAAARALVERVFIDHLSRPALDVRSAELQLLIDGWRSKSSGRHCAAYFRPVMRWACKRGLMTKGDPLEAPPQNAIVQPVLTRDETARLLIAAGWRAHDIAARFMLLTGARRDEVCGATWNEINPSTGSGGLWTIPGERRKDTRLNTQRSREDHIIPLSRQALALLNLGGDRQRGGDGGQVASTSSGLIFTGDRGAKLINWPRWSRRMEERLGFDVTPHALRRTCATLAGDLGCPPHVVSALLGHRSIGGSLHAGYNQSRYRAEVGNALQMVADLLDALEAGPDNVISLRA
jgi:integrase